MIPPSTRPPMLDPMTTPVETPESTGVVERHVSSPLPLCRGPFDHVRLSASVKLIKKGDAQERETVQFIGLMSFDIILNGGWRAGAMIMVYGGRPFLGVSEMSVH